MEDRKLITLLVPLLLVGFFVLSAPFASAYGVETHAYLTDEIINFYNQNYSNNQIPSELRDYLIDGSRKEDEAPRWLNHFYDPVYDRGLDTPFIKGYRSKDWAQDAGKQNEAAFRVTHFISSVLTAAEQRNISEISTSADFTWNRAIEFYAQGDKEKAMFALGHVLHLIEDLGVPDHTRNDSHAGGSPYEEFTKRFNLNSPDGSLAARVSGRGVIALNNMDGYFNSLATYSNNNFYSLDTIGIQSGYNLPQPIEYKLENGYRYALGKNDDGQNFKLFKQAPQSSVLISSKDGLIFNAPEIMTDYWNHLSPQVVQHGAGVVSLFFQEAEKAKNDPKFAKKEKENFLTKAVDAAKTAFNQVFNKAENKPVAVIDVSKDNQQSPVNNLQPKVENKLILTTPRAPSQPTSTIKKIEVAKKEVAKVEKQSEKLKKSEQALRQQIQECNFDTNQSPSHQEVVINEVAWMGGSTGAGLGATDEWIELKNLTSKAISLSGWQIVSQDENIQAIFEEGAVIPANGFYLLERSNDNSVPGIGADFIYTGALSNSNEGLRLFTSGCSLIDEVLASPGWPAGDNNSKRTMQRNEDLGWSTYGGTAINGVFGTPKVKNGPVLKEEVLNKSVNKASTVSASISSGSGSGGSSGSSAGAVSQANVLITEVQITGGSGKTDYDFIEIYNPNNSSVNLNGHRLVKRTKTGTSDTSIKSWTADTIIPANSYYLWANSGYTEISVTPDVTTSATISNDNGVAIRFGAEDTGTIVDAVGWGEAANAFVEGAVFATNPGANQSIHRKTGSGYVDTGNNANDFELKTCLTPKAASCAAVNQAPTAVLSFNPASPTTADTVNFTGASSSDPDGSIASYSWSFGDSSSASSTSATTTHNYSSAGSYTASLTVFDNQGASSTASTTVTVTSPAPVSSLSSVLFEQADSSGSGILLAGGQFFSLGTGANGSANKLKVKFKPDNVTVNNQFYIAPIRIKENGGLGLGFWYASDETKINQPKYCFTTAESDISKEVTFTFASSLNFLSSKTYEAYLLFLRDQPGNVCSNNQDVGTGGEVQGIWAANASNTLIYFQIGS